MHGDIARHVKQAFRVVEDDPQARVDQVVGDPLRSTRRHRQHADNDVLVAHDVLPEFSGALRGLTKTSAVKSSNCISDKIGQSNCVISRESCKLADLQFPL